MISKKLSYCIKQKNIDNVIIGVDSISQLNANIKAAAYEVNEETLKCINNICNASYIVHSL